MESTERISTDRIKVIVVKYLEEEKSRKEFRDISYVFPYLEVRMVNVEKNALKVTVYDNFICRIDEPQGVNQTNLDIRKQKG